MNKNKRRKSTVPAWMREAGKPRRSAVGGSRMRLDRECRECFGFPYHSPNCAKVQ